MPYEIDFLPVGEGEKGGDAIAMRFGNLRNPAEQTVVIIDGGTKASGAALVGHIKVHYNTTTVDAVVCTHSDADHASGLTEVIENLTVGRLVMHLPWNHLNDVDQLLKGAELSTDRLKRHFKKSLDNAHELESLAKKKSIPIVEPFSDSDRGDGVWCVLGPSIAFYESLLESFRCADELLPMETLLQKVFARAEGAVKWIAETWSSETLVEPDDKTCSAENNSSVILLFKDVAGSFLFTSDAGVAALNQAANRAAMIGIDLKKVEAQQIPHHGSKHNVGPAILDRIVGPKKQEKQPSKTAFVSAPKDGGPKHPSKRVVNAFLRRGANVYTTQGKAICHRSPDAPLRAGWCNATALPFSDQVEE